MRQLAHAGPHILRRPVSLPAICSFWRCRRPCLCHFSSITAPPLLIDIVEPSSHCRARNHTLNSKTGTLGATTATDKYRSRPLTSVGCAPITHRLPPHRFPHLPLPHPLYSHPPSLSSGKCIVLPSRSQLTSFKARTRRRVLLSLTHRGQLSFHF
jgi:hypothetical protein